MKGIRGKCLNLYLYSMDFFWRVFLSSGFSYQNQLLGVYFYLVKGRRICRRIFVVLVSFGYVVVCFFKEIQVEDFGRFCIVFGVILVFLFREGIVFDVIFIFVLIVFFVGLIFIF